MRVLEARAIPYQAKIYDPHGAFHPAEEAARLLGADPASVYKTLVVLRDGVTSARPILVMTAAARQLDLKLLARELDIKKLRMASLREAEVLTGMQAGGISALGLRKPERFDILIEDSARKQEFVHISAGVRGTDLALRTSDLVTVTGARYVRAR